MCWRLLASELYHCLRTISRQILPCLVGVRIRNPLLVSTDLRGHGW